MEKTSLEIRLSHGGNHDVTIHRAFGTPAEILQYAEEKARFYIEHYSLDAGRCEGLLLVDVEHSSHGAFRHTIEFIPPAEQDPRSTQADTEVKREPSSSDLDEVAAEHVNEAATIPAVAVTRSPRMMTAAAAPTVSPDDAPSTASTNQSDDVLPCTKCAKRVICDSESQSSSDKEKKHPDLNGTVREAEMACQHDRRLACKVCPRPSRCVAIPESARNAWKDLLVAATEVLQSSTRSPGLNAHALQCQRRLEQILRQASGRKGAAARKQKLGKANDGVVDANELDDDDHRGQKTWKRLRIVASEESIGGQDQE